jgi:hypothetical protein
MTPEQWQQVREVLAEALELNPEDRPAFLDRVCSSDHRLRQEVDLLSGRRRRACALASVRRPNCVCGFPACSFHEDT